MGCLEDMGRNMIACLHYSAFFLILVLVLPFPIEAAPARRNGLVGIEDCPKACNYRCSKTHHSKPCLKYCNICCRKCLCVPSGTYGHKEECPCYDRMKTKKGGPKCP